MSSEFDRDMDFFEHFHGFDQEPFDFSEYCNAGEYIGPALEAQTLDHPAADAGNELFDADASVGVSEPNQAPLHAVVPESNQSESGNIASSGSAPPGYLYSSSMIDTAAAPSGPPYKCTEANCRSKAKFTTLSQFSQHVRNIHQQPLLCTVPGCTYRKPFGKESDLIRHQRSKHEANRPHICPDESCLAHADGFKRNDKLLKHLREDHPRVQCQQPHCFAVVLDFEQQSHMEEAHGPFECALGRCRFSPPSNFTGDGLKRHLVYQHKISILSAFTMTYQMKLSTTIGFEHLLNDPTKPQWEECSVCCKTGGVTACITGDV